MLWVEQGEREEVKICMGYGVYHMDEKYGTGVFWPVRTVFFRAGRAHAG